MTGRQWRPLRQRGIVLLTALAVIAASLAAGRTGVAAATRVSHVGSATAAADWLMYRGSAEGNPVLTTGQNLAVNWMSPPLKSLAVEVTPHGNALYVGGMVAFGPQKAQFHDPFYALDVRTGKILWSTFTPNWHTRAPIVVNGVIYLGVGNSWAASGQPVDWDTVVRGTGPSGVYAYSATTGKPLWAFATPGAVHNTPLYDHGMVYAVTGDRMFYAINARTGTLAWKLAIPSYDSVSSPIRSGNLVYFGGAHPYATYAVNIATHKIAWQTRLPQVVGATDDCTPAVSGGLVYIEGATSARFKVMPPTGTPVGRKLFALDAHTGKIVWTFDEGLGHSPFFYAASTPTVVGGTVYFGSAVTNRFYAVNARTGALRWAFHLGKKWTLANMIGESGTVANSVVWTGSYGGLLLGLRASDGAVLVKKQLPAGHGAQGAQIYAGSPVVVDHTLIVTSSFAGRVLAFSIPQLLQHG
jgi:outer membrane protein assembly factor BamB